MDGIGAIRSYVDRIVTGDGRCSRGMKVLLLDVYTSQIVSCVYTQTELLGKEVYLASRLDDSAHNRNLERVDDSGLTRNEKELAPGDDPNATGHLKALCYVRPTEVNAGLLVRELSNPRFAEYHIFFSGIVPSGLLRLLAESDEREVVRQVQEFYADFLPINDDLVTLNCRNAIPMAAASGTSWEHDHAYLYDRHVAGLQSILLALKRQPATIRYQKSSAVSKRLATDMQRAISDDQIFHFRRGRAAAPPPPGVGGTMGEAVASGANVVGSSAAAAVTAGANAVGVGVPTGGLQLLVLDRMDDPVTPLLSQWTYQAMVHELLGLNNNRVVLRGAPNIAKDMEEVVLSATQDEFFARHRFSNFGELGEAVKKLLEDYQKQTQTHNVSRLQSIEEMQSFMEKFPELRSQSHNVSKHVAVMGELARLVEICSLMDVSAFEQELACADDHASHIRILFDKLTSPAVKIPDKLRLGLLYALRYERSGNVNRVKSEMARGGVPATLVEQVDIMLRYAGADVRGPGLYGLEATMNNPGALVSKMTKNFITTVQGVSNVYAQHDPVLMETVQSIVRGKLSRDSHPYVPGAAPPRASVAPGVLGDPVPEEMIIFVVGGVTYEEATKVNEFNKNMGGRIRVLLGGSTVHNSTSFLEELKGL